MSEVSRTRQQPPLTAPDPVASVSFLRRRGTILVAAAAAVVLIAAAGIGGLRAWTGDPSKQEVIAAVVAARDAHTDRVDLDGGGSMTLISSAGPGPRRGARGVPARPRSRRGLPAVAA
ncbi:MAG: hypothetical protein GEU96_20930 [Propionibacteriales bacterium]|nr:hypothetical protein [Propionibacteriales bacterium]